jgi:DNA-binding PadR family transcriptional regulator
MTESRKQGQEPRPTERAEPIPEHDPTDLTRFRVDLLATLGRYGAPAKGTAIKAAVEARYGTEIPHSRLYQNLDRLVADGFLTKRERDGRTNEYALTDAGRLVLRARGEWVAPPEAEGIETEPHAVTDGSRTVTNRIDTLLDEIVDDADDPQVRERAREVLQLRDAEVHDR